VGAADAAAITKTSAHVGAVDTAITETSAHVGAASRFESASLAVQAKAALAGLGWKPAIAGAAVAAAMAMGSEMTLERLIFESLRRCPAPKA
jgi:hypothetical protein